MFETQERGSVSNGLDNVESAVQVDMAERVRDMLGSELVPVALSSQLICGLPFLWRGLDLYMLSPGDPHARFAAAMMYVLGATLLNPLLLTIVAMGLQLAPLWVLQLRCKWK